MVEELKILAEVLKGVTNGAIIGVSVYLLIDLLKIVTVAYFSFARHKTRKTHKNLRRLIRQLRCIIFISQDAVPVVRLLRLKPKRRWIYISLEKSRTGPWFSNPSILMKKKIQF